MSPHKQAFTPSKSSIPPCVGCEKCGDSKEGTLYSLQHGGHYLCTKCFFATPPGSNWPTPKAKGGTVKAEAPDPVPFTIGPGPKKYCYDLGEARHKSKDPKWTRKKSDKLTDVEADYLGVKGEWIADRWLDEQGVLKEGLDTEIRRHGEGKDKKDLILTNGWKIAVKYNHRMKGYLMFERKSDWPKDVKAAILIYGECDPQRDFCLCWNMDRVEHPKIAGWIDREKFSKVHTKRNLGLGDRWFVTVNDLYPMHRLVAGVKKEK